MSYIAQNIETGEFLEKEEKDGLKLTNNIDDAQRLDLADGTKFLNKYNEQFMLKSEKRILRELESKNV